MHFFQLHCQIVKILQFIFISFKKASMTESIYNERQLSVSQSGTLLQLTKIQRAELCTECVLFAKSDIYSPNTTWDSKMK